VAEGEYQALTRAAPFEPGVGGDRTAPSSTWSRSRSIVFGAGLRVRDFERPQHFWTAALGQSDDFHTGILALLCSTARR
jgi:hypothetical protein